MSHVCGLTFVLWILINTSASPGGVVVGHTGGDEGLQDGEVPAGDVISDEEGVLATQGDPAKLPLRDILVERVVG